MKIKIRCESCGGIYTVDYHKNNWICPNCKSDDTWTIDIVR